MTDREKDLVRIRRSFRKLSGEQIQRLFHAYMKKHMVRDVEEDLEKSVKVFDGSLTLPERKKK